VIEAWGFEYKTGAVWDKVLHNFGHYVSIRHLLIATRGSCTPDRPTPMIDSVQTIRRGDVHSAKPEEFRQMIERLYDGPYLRE
jgi:N6-adenosine-specific RNA methylase IME4